MVNYLFRLHVHQTNEAESTPCTGFGVWSVSARRMVAATSALCTLQTRDLCNLAAPGVQDRARADEDERMSLGSSLVSDFFVTCTLVHYSVSERERERERERESWPPRN